MIEEKTEDTPIAANVIWTVMAVFAVIALLSLVCGIGFFEIKTKSSRPQEKLEMSFETER